MSETPEVRCPAGRLINDPLGCVCRIMEEDQSRRDSVLEGAPVGVFISAREDPSTFAFFCCGDAVPSTSPDADPVAHYTSCPIWAAGQEITAAERAFAPPVRPEVGDGADAGEPITEEEEATIAAWAASRHKKRVAV